MPPNRCTHASAAAPPEQAPRALITELTDALNEALASACDAAHGPLRDELAVALLERLVDPTRLQAEDVSFAEFRRAADTVCAAAPTDDVLAAAYATANAPLTPSLGPAWEVWDRRTVLWYSHLELSKALVRNTRLSLELLRELPAGVAVASLADLAATGNELLSHRYGDIPSLHAATNFVARAAHAEDHTTRFADVLASLDTLAALAGVPPSRHAPHPCTSGWALLLEREIQTRLHRLTNPTITALPLVVPPAFAAMRECGAVLPEVCALAFAGAPGDARELHAVVRAALGSSLQTGSLATRATAGRSPG